MLLAEKRYKLFGDEGAERKKVHRPFHEFVSLPHASILCLDCHVKCYNCLADGISFKIILNLLG